MKVYITRKIPDTGITLLQQNGFDIVVSPHDRPLTKQELIEALKADSYDALVSLLTDTIDNDIFEAAPNLKIVANYAVGFNNINLEEAKKRNIFVSNTPGVLTNSVAEFSFALLLALARQIIPADTFMRSGKYQGWDPDLFIGYELHNQTMGIVGAGRIGAQIAKYARGFDMNVIYYDVSRNDVLEKQYGATYFADIADVLKQSDVVNICVPLIDSTHHLINKERLELMKSSAFLINTSRGPVIDEVALVEALQKNSIAGAGLDVYEFEPKLSEGLQKLSNVILAPHIASATEFARNEMARVAALNVIDALLGRIPQNSVK